MANVRDIKRRIKGVQNIQQITRAMKMIAAVKIKRIERLLKSRRPYCEKLFEIINEIIAQLDELSHPLLEMRKESLKVGILVICGDKGLCGSYNMNVIRHAERFLRSLSEEKRAHVLYVAGGKAYRYLLKKGYNMEKYYFPWEPTNELAEVLAHTLSQDFIDRKFDELHCIYTKSISLTSMKVWAEQFFPIKREENTAKKNQLFIFEPVPVQALNTILPVFVRENMMRILLDSRTAELSSRINAMANATENAESLVEELKLNYYRARQESITKELLEIVSCSEVLHKG